jgi:hypothetical protein
VFSQANEERGSFDVLFSAHLSGVFQTIDLQQGERLNPMTTI